MQLSEMLSSHPPARLPFKQGIKMIFRRSDCPCILPLTRLAKERKS